ncbi:hypothetical protein CDD81_2341 [Ophiocordyceps australis]|uniref:Gfo/Idh/MocA-like oxidoreductase N-terminal domain-containing protein n=1 Tax=Ophiocordyceps australis TaxID=1399860 RepID=A0A2C5XYB7_9HYPO|nr:hypothetical protein CDD81_2341 [Ophiocordyceps australis]
MAQQHALGVALIGSGIFIKEEHLPAVLKCPSLAIKALYSRSLASAQEAAGLIPGLAPAAPTVDIYADDAGPGRGYTDLLSRPDVAAVVIALPITTQPSFIEAALRAGKHVLAEKPVAGDLETAKQLVKLASNCQGDSSSPTLSIAENYRFLPRLMYMREQARHLGRVTHFGVRVMTLMPETSKWCRTSWRREPTHQGGFLLDGGVHHAAGARHFLSGPENRAVSVRAYTDSVHETLPPLDTVVAVVRTASGATGTFQHSVGTLMDSFEWFAACEQGSVRSDGDVVTVKAKDGQETTRKFERVSGVTDEVKAWAASLTTGSPEPRLAPEEALADLEFVDLMLRSGEQRGAEMTYELQP